MSKPFAVIVEAEIQAERMDEFLKMIEHNAVNSRKEPGCKRFGRLYVKYRVHDS
jgi:quinol monooxygenase YgiN